MKCFAICKLDGTKVRSCMNWKRGQLSWLQTAHASSKISAALGVCVTPEVPLYSRFSWTTKVLPTVCIIFVCFSLCSSSVPVLCTLGLNSWWKMVLGAVLLMSWEEGSEIPLFELRQEGKTLSSTNPGPHAALCPSGKGFRQSRLLWLECSLDSVPESFPLCFLIPGILQCSAGINLLFEESLGTVQLLVLFSVLDSTIWMGKTLVMPRVHCSL